ncbi:hypothetical protein [Peribacillus butanolivorans]|uniref:hypothetical protein n=1 Tax=Peribacillus butanolivorans TaxID=421767 RepID=UPI00367334A7
MAINFNNEIEYLLEEPDYKTDHLNTLPENCPICNHSIAPVHIMEYSLGLYNLSLVCGCPRKDCGKIFIVEYQSTEMNDTRYDLKAFFPQKYPVQKFPEEISNLSSKFVKIYNQAFIAEITGLNEICGGGYRKALEFLVKDYAIKLNPGDEDVIKSKLLKPCIKGYIEHPRVAFMAERAAWLGNDEAHYVRKWDEKDVQDLKKLIKLTVSYIETELISKEIEAEMAEGR